MVQQTPASQQIPVTRFASQGELKRVLPYGTAWYSAAEGSFFNWDHGNDGRIVAWMRAMGVEGLKPVEETEAKPLSPLFAQMQAWPSPNSVRVEGDTVLVKLGN